jgi:NAD(P)-dependent dehydrogenase (short-subunit alcohol dehydrogenase family)
VLLTGGSRGIGRAVAEALIARGDRLALLARDPGALGDWPGDDGHAVIEADLAEPQLLEAAVDRAAEALGGIDAVVGCAGVVEYAEVGAVSGASLARQLAVNLQAPFLIAQRATGYMERAGGGAIVLMSSTLAMRPAPMTSAYAATKAALEAVTRSFALELGERDIRVNAVAPGVIDTDMVRVVRLREGEAAPRGEQRAARIAEQLEQLRALHPLGRLGTPQDVARTVLYLLDAPYVTGTVVSVDGGLQLGEGQP